MARRRSNLRAWDSPGEAPCRLLLLCPLEFERTVLTGLRRSRHGCELPDDAAVEVCGPGSAGVRRWFERFDAAGASPPSAAVLVGTAGGLVRELTAGSAIFADCIVDGRGGAWSPSLTSPAGSRRGTILSLDAAATSPHEKARHRERSGAVAVDLESAAFAEQCEARSWPWGVIRGISDAVECPLPPQVDRWVDADGRLRVLPLLASLASSPSTIGMLPGLRRRSHLALAAVAATVEIVVASLGGTMESARESTRESTR